MGGFFMKAPVAVLGSGSWGTALAIVLADNGHSVKLWSRRKEQVDEINTLHVNRRYLSNIKLPEHIRAVNQLDEAVNQVRTVLLVTPTSSMRDVLAQLRSHLKEPVTIVHASKGIEPRTSKRISEIIEEEIPETLRSAVVVLSGPSHAEEVSLRQPTTVTVSSKDSKEAARIQDLFINHYFRVYTNDDLIGVEIAGALKNIIALGAGISDGLGHGDNAKAALITRGLAEMTRLGVVLGAHPLTFTGLAGMGDLIVTCTSMHSRNWRAGNLLGTGHTLNETLEQAGMAVEGVRTAEAVHYLLEKVGIEMPISESIYHVLFNHKHPKDAVNELMNRDKRHEYHDIHELYSSKIYKG